MHAGSGKHFNWKEIIIIILTLHHMLLFTLYSNASMYICNYFILLVMSIYQYIYYIHAALSAPLNLTFSPGDVLNDSITFTWLSPEEPNGVVQFYQLQQSSSAGVIYVNTTDNSTTIVLSNLVPGTQYNFSVRAFTVAFGPFSDQITIYTADGEDYMSFHCCHKITLM